MDSIPNFISKLDRLSIYSSFLLEPRHHSIPQNQLNCSLAERKQIADRGSLCRTHLRKPSFRQTDSSPSWTHKSDSLPNFGVNNLPASYQNLQYFFQDMLLLTHHLSLIFLRAWQKIITEKEGEFNPTITLYTDYPVRNPNNNFRF
jgi:hypothetical protein